MSWNVIIVRVAIVVSQQRYFVSTICIAVPPKENFQIARF